MFTAVKMTVLVELFIHCVFLNFVENRDKLEPQNLQKSVLVAKNDNNTKFIPLYTRFIIYSGVRGRDFTSVLAR